MNKLIIAAIFIAILGQPIGASALATEGTRENETPVIIDALALRPLGILGTAFGFTLWVVSVPIQAVTRPTNIPNTFNSMVINPARFTWVDPLGHHPDRISSNSAGEIE